MTEDYKKNLIDYATGNITPGTPTTDEIFKEIIEVARSKWQEYMPKTWTDMRIEGLIKPNENISNLGVMYGGYKNTNGSFGFIILVDNNMTPIKYIDEYDSGTKLRYIQCMIQGDDNLFYAIDDAEMSYHNYNIYSTEKRFIMLNNFSVPVDGEYKVILRKSYIMSGTNYQNFYCDNIYKETGVSHFVFTGKYAAQNNAWASRIKAIEVKINVGQSNEWNYYQVANPIYALADYVVFNSSGASKIQFVSVGSASYRLILESKDYSQNSLNETTLYTFDFRTYANTNKRQGLFMDENNVYVVLDNQDLVASEPGGGLISVDRYVALCHYNFNTSTLEFLYKHYLGTTTNAINEERMQIDKCTGKLYIAFYNNFGTNTADYYIQRYEGVWNPILIGENKGYIFNQRSFYVVNNFNLLQIIPYNNNLRSPTWYFPIIKEVYNPTQYNGEPYVSVDSLTPLYSNLYSNGSLIFSRNLYNISKQNNMTMSSVEIPNNYLNDIAITQNDLISETNQILTTDNKQWNKNIYEVVDLNFLNTISVIDEDTNTPYLESAIKLNNATTDGGSTNYQNTPCNKFRINYLDGTTSVDNFTWSSIDDTHKETTISLYVDKAITSIDLISYDTDTIYLTIPLEVEIGKTYSITQKVRVE